MNLICVFSSILSSDSSPQCDTADILQFSEGTSQNFAASCTVGYRGNLLPKMECSGDGVTTSSSTENVLMGNSVTYNLQLTAHWPLYDGHPIVCRTSISHVSSVVRPTVMCKISPVVSCYLLSAYVPHVSPCSRFIK